MSELLPLHTPTEVEALREDLKANGLKVLVVIDENGGVIDGRLRAKLCDELKIDWRPTAKVEPGLTADQKAALRIRLNLLRRSTPPTAKPAAGVCADTAPSRRRTLQRHHRPTLRHGPQQRLPDTVGDGSKGRDPASQGNEGTRREHPAEIAT